MLSNTTPLMFNYVYVIGSLADQKRYIGYTKNIDKRIMEHNAGANFSTKLHKPYKLIYFDGYFNENGAKRLKKYLKTTQGCRFLGIRLIKYKYEKLAKSR